MKRFLLFASNEKYDYGFGWQLFIESFDTKRKAVNAGKHYAFYQVVDITTGEIVAED